MSPLSVSESSWKVGKPTPTRGRSGDAKRGWRQLAAGLGSSTREGWTAGSLPRPQPWLRPARPDARRQPLFPCRPQRRAHKMAAPAALWRRLLLGFAL